MTDPKEVLPQDLIASAKDAQWSPAFLGAAEVVKALAPAKVNLFLGIGERRADGYHDVTDVLHALALHDVLYIGRDPMIKRDDLPVKAFEEGIFVGPDASVPEGALATGPANNLIVSIDVADKTTGLHDAVFDIPLEQNLCFKAIDALAHEIGYSENERITMRIEKNIPAQAGLGGGSSDAAATLIAMGRLWGVAESGETLRKVARSLGADVAFFLEGGCAKFVNRGDVLAERYVPMKDPLIVVKPPFGVSTVQAYEAFDADPIFAPAGYIATMDDARDAADVPLFNGLEAAADSLQPELASIRAWLAGHPGVRPVSEEDPTLAILLCGSGSATFAITRSFSDATAIVCDALARGWWARATTFSSLKASVL